jgi:Mitochondrial carrier protein
VRKDDGVGANLLLLPPTLTSFLPSSRHVRRQQTTTGKSSGLAELVAKMYRDQGMSGFYRGVEANVMRACVLNATKMGSYDMCKGLVVDYSAFYILCVPTTSSSSSSPPPSHTFFCFVL